MRPALVVLLVTIALLTVPPAHAQSSPTYQPGPVVVDQDLVFGENETVTFLAGTTFTGSARIIVHGVLHVEGTIDSRVEIEVPLILDGNGTSTLSHAHLWGVNDAALTITSGNLTMTNVAFEGNRVGLNASTPGRIEVRDALFRAHPIEAARITGARDITLENVSLEDGQLGLALDLTESAVARVANSTFERNVQHAIVDVSGPSADVRFARNAFGPPTTGPNGALPALTLRGPASASGAPTRAVSLSDDSFLAGDTALRVEGSGFRVDSFHDAFLGNRVGVSLAAADITLRNDTFNERERDIDGASTSSVRIEGVSFTPATPASVPAAVPAGPAGRGALAAWTLPAIALALLAGGGALAWLRRRPRGGVPALATMDAPAALPAAPAPPADLTALTAMERRVLEDLVANPGTAQSAVAQRLGFTRQALHYHVKKLEARGLLTKSAHGRETRCYAAPSVAAALARVSPPAVTDAGALEKE